MDRPSLFKVTGGKVMKGATVRLDFRYGDDLAQMNKGRGPVQNEPVAVQARAGYGDNEQDSGLSGLVAFKYLERFFRTPEEKEMGREFDAAEWRDYLVAKALKFTEYEVTRAEEDFQRWTTKAANRLESLAKDLRLMADAPEGSRGQIDQQANRILREICYLQSAMNLDDLARAGCDWIKATERLQYRDGIAAVYDAEHTK